jgi:hypothetical protein
VPGRARQRSGLAPAGHPAVDQRRPQPQQLVGPEAQAFHDTGPEPLQQDVGPLDQRPHDGEVVGVLEVERDRALAAIQQRRRPEGADQSAACAPPVDADDVGAQVGQQHAAERTRPQPGELDDPYPLQRSH